MAAPGGDGVSLYRAVSLDELENALRTGRLTPVAHSLAGKFFAERLQDAIAWGWSLEPFGKFRILRVEFPRAVVNDMERWAGLDTIGDARYARPEQLALAVSIREVTLEGS